MKKDFDCVEMKHKIQEKIYEEIKDMSIEEEIEYFRKGAEEFRAEMERLRKKKKKNQNKKKAGKKVSGKSV